jgi:hypothetical protein
MCHECIVDNSLDSTVLYSTWEGQTTRHGGTMLCEVDLIDVHLHLHMKLFDD